MILKTKDLRDKSKEELNQELANLRKDLFETKMSFFARKLENTSSMKTIKKSIAKILTIINERSREEEKA